MEKLVLALGPIFAAGFAVQQFLEILDPVVIKTIGKADKRLVLGILSLTLGLALAFGGGLRVLESLDVATTGFLDAIVTALIISAGTEGFNSIMKFLGHAKESNKGNIARTSPSRPDT
ncbi:MAG: hypothetical protein ACE5JP_17780 [Candidatus Bipolaricaulia bacterium]